VAPQVVVDEVVELTLEAQRYGARLLRLSERSAAPLSGAQYEVLMAHEGRLGLLDLRITAELDGSRWLHAGNRVGSYRFIGVDSAEVLVQVDPKVESADVFRMLDRANRAVTMASEETDLPVGDQPISGVFLLFFARRVSAFLRRNRFRSYRFIEESSPSRVKGRPLIEQYALQNVPRGRAHILPTRHVDLSSNVFENQVIAYAVLVATRLAQLLGLENSEALRNELQTCTRLLVGVDPRRVTSGEVRAHRLSRATKHFRPVHDLCLVLLENQSVMLDAGERIPFAAFSLNMPNLFERYVRAVFATTFGPLFVGRKNQLEYPTGFGGKPIKLDGLMVKGTRRVVVEAKYRTLDETDDVLVLGKVPERHVYQTVAYASHELVRASKAIIVYPTWDPNGPPIRLSDPIDDFGWTRFGERHLELRLVGVDLGASFQRLVDETGPRLSPLMDST